MLSTRHTRAWAEQLGRAQHRWWGAWLEIVWGPAHEAPSHEANENSEAAPGALERLAAESAALLARPPRALAVGDSAALAKTIAQDDILLFALLTGDVNPVHLDDAYAERTRFGERIAHGMLSAGLISAVLGTKLPGPGAVYLSQTLKFRAPVTLGDEVTATATVTEQKEGKPIYTLRTVCTKRDGTVVLEGEAVILYEPV